MGAIFDGLPLYRTDVVGLSHLLVCCRVIRELEGDTDDGTMGKSFGN